MTATELKNYLEKLTRQFPDLTLAEIKAIKQSKEKQRETVPQ